MPKATQGILVQCDPSIKAIISKIDAERYDFIVEDLDDEHVVVKVDKLPELKEKLNEMLKDTQMDVDESGSE